MTAVANIDHELDMLTYAKERAERRQVEQVVWRVSGIFYVLDLGEVPPLDAERIQEVSY